MLGYGWLRPDGSFREGSHIEGVAEAFLDGDIARTYDMEFQAVYSIAFAQGWVRVVTYTFHMTYPQYLDRAGPSMQAVRKHLRDKCLPPEEKVYLEYYRTDLEKPRWIEHCKSVAEWLRYTDVPPAEGESEQDMKHATRVLPQQSGCREGLGCETW